MDSTDNLIEAVVACRDHGMMLSEVHGVVTDTFAAPWSGTTGDAVRTVVKKVFDKPRAGHEAVRHV